MADEMTMTGTTLRHVRKTLKLSKPEMAELVGTHIRNYYRHEKAREVPLTIAAHVVTLLKSPQVLHARIAEIRGGQNAIHVG